jgi:hypothetical protein
MSAPPPPVPVFWLNEAQQSLDCDLAAADDDPRAPFRRHVEQVNRRLQATAAEFYCDTPVAAVVVRRRFRGYRPSPAKDILLVEFVLRPAEGEPAGESETHLVKVAIDPAAPDPNPARARRDRFALSWEHRGWEACRPPGLRGDPILTILRPGVCEPQADGTRRLATLVYGDAYGILGGGEVVSLEQAFLDATRFGFPAEASLAQALHRLYAQLNQRFYQRSYPVSRTVLLDPARDQGEPPSEAPACGVPHFRRHLLGWLALWRDRLPGDPDPDGTTGGLRGSDRLRFRREVLAALADRRDTFLDPCDALKALLEQPAHAADVVAGCAHGDLHGRNVLLSLAESEAGSLAVFDYEALRPDNLLGWDFVKLETELKARAYPLLFRGALPKVACQVHDFETALIAATERMHDELPGADPDGVPGGEAGARLARLLLAVRREAWLYLGVYRTRPREWLEEYYFLLACYGLCTARFATYRQRETVAAYVSAGTAARRLTWPYASLAAACRAAEERARAGLDSPPEELPRRYADFAASEPAAALGHGPRFHFLRTWARADAKKHEAAVRRAARLLDELRHAFPHVLEIEQELILALLELRDPDGADALLRENECRYPNPTEETLCLYGSWLKRQVPDGAAAVDGTLPPEARVLLEKSLKYYQRAFALRENYYPGINVVSLHFLLGNREQAQPMLDRVVQGAAPHADDTPEGRVQKGGTRAEAFVWIGQADEAVRQYRRAAQDPACQPQYRASMRRQLELMLRFAPDLRPGWPAATLDDLFGPP